MHEILDRATHTIVQQVESMKEMVNAFSQYARAPDIDIGSFSIGKLVHEVVDLYRAEARTVDIVLVVDSSLPEIEADIGRVRQILHNLLRNAIEALEHSDGARIEVRVEAAKFHGQPMVEISVADNGPGFQTESLSQVFDPYVTTKPKGTGLGLAIVKKLVEEHVGTIDAENQESGGAVIRVRLPIDETARVALMSIEPSRTEQRRERA